MNDWYCGIDQSFSGYAVAFYSPDRKALIYRKAFVSAAYGSGVDRTMHVGAWLRSILAEVGTEKIAHVCLEGYARGSRFRREEAGELSYETRRSLRESLMYNNTCYPTIVAPMQRAKFATGSGKAGKKDVIAAVQKTWGVDLSNNNDADAYVLARIACDIHRGNHPSIHRPKHQQDVLDTLTPHTERPMDGVKMYNWPRMQVA